MGHTLETGTQLIQEFESSLQPLSRALRKKDRELLTQLMATVYFQSAPIAYHAAPDPTIDFILAMLIGVLKRVDKIEVLLARHPELAAELTDELTNDD